MTDSILAECEGEGNKRFSSAPLNKRMTMENTEQTPLGVYSQGKTLYFFSDVNSSSVCEAIKLLQNLTTNPRAEVQIFLNCPGGCVYDGLALYDYIRTLVKMKRKIHVIGTGLVASLGVIIFLACDKRYLTTHTRLMVHEVTSMVNGRLSDIKIDLKETQALESMCDKILAERTGQALKTVKQQVKSGDKYLSAEEAVQAGYATHILD